MHTALLDLSAGRGLDDPTNEINETPNDTRSTAASDSTRESTVSVSETLPETLKGLRKPCTSYVLPVGCDNKLPELSFSLLFFAHLGSALTLFLATTDSTILSTSLPTIVSELRASQDQYSWVAVAYMLTQTAGQPLYGKLSDLIGRKVVLYTSMFIFCIGSLLSGASKSITWLILSRALSGVGGGGIVSSVWTITSEIVPVYKRAHWSQALSLTWASSAVAGPLLGGLFSNNSGPFNWRWSFYINVPICLVAFVVLVISLRNVNLGRSSDTSWHELVTKFDFFGLFAFVSGTSFIIVGFSFVTLKGWTAPTTLGLIIGGTFLLALGAVYEVVTSREALFPPQLFKDVSCVAILVVVFLHSFCFTAGTFYVAIYFQAVDGMSPFAAGIASLPYSLGSTLISIPAAWFMGFWQIKRGNMSGQKWISFAGLIIGAAGFGLMITLDERSSGSIKFLFPLVAGVGLGLLLHAPYQVFTRALQSRNMAVGTSAFFLMRFTGATIGLSLAGTVFNIRLDDTLPSEYPGGSSTIDLATVKSITPPELRAEVLNAIARSIQTIWTLCSPFLGLAALLTILMKSTFVQDSGRNETVEQMGTSSKEHDDLESTTSSQC